MATMLHWFAGQKATEASNDPDATSYAEPPETPAPVFAVRAFKHAIFGTPQTNHAKPRRHSNTENGRPKTVEPRPVRPGLNRPKSTNDAVAIAKHEPQSLEEPIGSPTKGILLTPGAAAARKKNVTFGEAVVDNEEKRPLKSGLPEDCPGKFPSPHNAGVGDATKGDESPDKGRPRSKLTEAFEQVRHDSRKRKSRGDELAKHIDDEGDNLVDDDVQPQSSDGKYWKREYDLYRTNTQREVKKLITKQKAAKSFAQMKDSQCAELADQLRQEHERVEILETKTRELAELVTDLQSQLQAARQANSQRPGSANSISNHSEKRERAGSESHRRGSMRSRGNGISEVEAFHKPGFHGEGAQAPREAGKNELKDHEGTKAEPVQRPSEPYHLSNVSSDLKHAARNNRPRGRSKPDELQLKPDDDIWARLDSSSNPFISQISGRPRGTNSALGVTSGTAATPLKALDINALSMDGKCNSKGSPQSMDVECKSTRDLERVDSKNSANDDGQKYDSPTAASVQAHDIPNRAIHSGDEVERQKAVGSHVDAKPLPPIPQLDRRSSALDANALSVSNAKENISPISKQEASQHDLNAKPSAIWSSMNAPTASKRVTSVTGKDGRELSQDRIAAARARIAARGRVTS